MQVYLRVTERVAAQMNKVFRNFLKDDRGTSPIECGLIFACILIAVVAVIKNLGDPLNTTFATGPSGR